MSMEILNEDKIIESELVKLRAIEVSTTNYNQNADEDISDDCDDDEEEDRDSSEEEDNVADEENQSFADDTLTDEEEIDSSSETTDDYNWKSRPTVIKKKHQSQIDKLEPKNDNVKVEENDEEISKFTRTTQNLNSENNCPKKHIIIGSFTFKMLFHYSREFLCILALILTTYATLQNRHQKIARAVPSKPLFGKDSYVQEWSNGNLGAVQNHVSASELSLVLFYAPWCAESLFAKHAYERVAKFYSREAYFAAINCWQPGGECRSYYSKVHRWPVLMAYLPRGFAVEYNGSWSFTSLSKFIDGIMKPVRRVHNQNDLLRLQISNDIVVLAVFKNMKSSTHYQTYFQTAFKWLEHDPLQNIKFAVYTGAYAADFNVTTVPALKMYLWNQSIEYNETDWSIETIHNWIRFRISQQSIWVSLPSTKSSTLAGYFEKNPTLVMFAPRNNIFDYNDAHLMLKQAAYLYRNCNNNTSIRLVTQNIPSIRKETQNKLEKLKKYCPTILKQKNLTNDKCSLNSPNSYNYVTCASMNASHKSSDSFSASAICHANPLQNEMISINSYCEAESAPEISTPVFRPRRKKSNNIEKFIDHRCPKALLKSAIRTQCKKVEAIENYSEFDDTTKFEENNHLHFEGLQCKFNRSLSFVMLDSLKHSEYQKQFADNLESKNPSSSSVFIIDNENESTFTMKSKVSTKNLLKFIEDFHKKELKRQLRSSAIKYNPKRAPSDKIIQIEEISSIKFMELLKWTKSTSVVLLYTPHCAFCNIISQTLLRVAKIMNSISVDFFRIDGYRNDLFWEYTMDTYPTLIIFSKNKAAETKVFPSSMKINYNNIFGFIVANLEPLDRLQILTNSCMLIKLNIPFTNCIKNLQHTVIEEIKTNLVLWQKQPNHRNEILQRLIVYKRVELSLLRAKQACDLEIVKKDIASIRYCH